MTADAAPSAEPLRRAALVAAARDLIVDDGLDALTLRRVAARLGVTAPALYAHVSGKDDLLRAVAEAELATMVERFAEVDEPDPVARMGRLAEAYVAHARTEPELFRVMFLFPPQLAVAAPTGTELPAATDAFEAAAAAAFDAAQQGRLAEGADPLVVALALWTAAHGAATVLQLGFDLPTDLEDRLVHDLLTAVLIGFTVSPDERQPGPG